MFFCNVIIELITTITFPDVPGPPLGPFEISGVCDSSLTIQWNPPETDGGSPITGYMMERREAFKKAWQKIGQTEAYETEMEVTALKKGTAYFFRVSAVNAAGPGEPLSPDEPITAGKKISE